MQLSPVLARIALRYAAGALVAYGLLAPEAGRQIAVDPDLALILGAAIGTLAEAAYARVKARGGRT